jgi:predicted TIM-barrel fold metal-dependent hydrolase
MTGATATTKATTRRVTCVDCDVHQAEKPGAMDKHLPRYFREMGYIIPGGPWNSPIGVMRADAKPRDGGPPGSDPQMILDHHMDPFGVDYAILTGSGILSIGTHPNLDYAAAATRAYNLLQLDTWLTYSDRFFGCVLVAPQYPEDAAKQIREFGGHPRVVQVLMTSATRTTLGQRFHWPIYEAACEMGLPVAVHPGAEARGCANGFIAGPPSTYLEWHTNLSQNYMGQVASLILEGVFEQFPTLKFVAIEGGFGWLPHLLWRMDKNWKALRTLAPALRKLPSEYAFDHLRLTTQPIEEPEKNEHLLAILEMIHADQTLMFSSDYPHWDNDSPMHGLPKLPDALRQRIMSDNALQLYRLPPERAA